MIKKIALITAKVIVGIMIFYLVVGFVVLPLVLGWAIKSQGTKILNHPVRVGSVYFNPIFLHLKIRDLAIMDKEKLVLAGFDRLSVDVGFWGLLNKAYRVEKFELEGLKINIVLKADGQINLMSLVPAAPLEKTATASPSSVKAEAPAVESSAAEIPLVIVDRVHLTKGMVHFVDETLQPNFAATLSDIDILLTGFSTRPDCQAVLAVQARLDQKGKISVESMMRPFVVPLQMESTFNMNSYALDVLSPYTGKFTGRMLKDGKMDLSFTYRIADNKLSANHKLLIQRFEFGEKVESKDALNLPFGLVVGLLEDPQGRITISLPVTGDMSKPDFHYWGLVGQVARNFFMSLVTKPFGFLGSMLGVDSGVDELGYVRFAPGKADLADTEKEKIALIIKGLKDRPKLRLEVNGSYDPDMDWKTIKRASLEKDYADIKSQSSKSDSWIYQMLYQRRFGIRDLWALTNKYQKKGGAHDDEALIAEIKRQIVENAPPDKVALDVLAAARARVVYDLFLSSGFDGARVRLGENHTVQGSMDMVPLEFTLTVFGEEPVSTEKTAVSEEK